MQDNRVANFFDWLASALCDGPLDWVENVYVYPMSLFIGPITRIEKTPEETREYIRDRRAEIRLHGAERMSSKVVQIGEWKRSGYRVLVEFRFHDTKAETIAFNRTWFLCHDQPDGTIKIQSVDIEHLGIPTARQELVRQVH